MVKEEFKYGNYLKDRENRLCKVEKIDKEGFEAYAINYPITSLPVGPIVLTVDLVTKLGFKKWKNKNIFTLDNVMIYLTSKGFAYGKFHSRTYLFYVHDLQNLFSSLRKKN